jgi:PhzF family phenazine biosynthesis protein
MKLFHVDAFTAEAFRGNPAAVCLLEGERDDRWMQSVAAEMNLAETAFLRREGDAFRLRWFTPVAEVDLCGHATLASAHILWQESILAPDDGARFQTRSGLLTAARSGDAIALNFPATPPKPADAKNVLAALGVSARFTGTTIFDYLVELESEDAVRNLKPDFQALAIAGMRGVIVTSQARDYDFVSRYFAPAYGINEDPVTGSTHCALAVYWSERLGKQDFRAYQASARGGELQVKLRGDRVELGGHAVTVTRGELLV